MENNLFFSRNLAADYADSEYDPAKLVASHSKTSEFCRKLYLLEKHCYFTSRFLKATGQMETTFAYYCEANNHFFALEKNSYHFLKWITKNTIGLTSVIARFELGLTTINNDEIYEDKILWPCDPLPLIYGLIQGNLSDESIQSGKYSMILSDTIIGGFDVEELVVSCASQIS